MILVNIDALHEAAKRIDCTRFHEKLHVHCGRHFTTWRNGGQWFAQLDGATDFGVGVDRESVIEMAQVQIEEGPDDEDD